VSNDLFQLIQRIQTVLPVYPVVPFEHRIGLMARNRHDNRVAYTRFPEVSHSAMPKIMKPEIFDPSRADGIPKSGFNVLNTLALMGENVRAPKGLRYPFQKVDQLLR